MAQNNSEKKVTEFLVSSQSKVFKNVNYITSLLKKENQIKICSLGKAICKAIDTSEALVSLGLCTITGINTSFVARKDKNEDNNDKRKKKSEKAVRIEIDIVKSESFADVIKKKLEMDEERKRIKTLVKEGRQRIQDKYSKASA